MVQSQVEFRSKIIEYLSTPDCMIPMLGYNQKLKKVQKERYVQWIVYKILEY